MSDSVVEVAVVGLGVMGSCTLWRLATRGVAAVGIDSHHPPHSFGQSKGESRILRRIQFEGDAYVRLGKLAYELWGELERQSGEAIFTRTGMLVIGPPDSQLIRSGRESAIRGNLDFELLDSSALRARYPQHIVDSDEIALLDPDGGYASPDLAVATALRLATGAGASTHLGCTVRSIIPGERGVVVATDQGDVHARQVVVAAGGWLPDLLPGFVAAVQVERHSYAYVRVVDATSFRPDRFPVWIRENSGHTGTWVGDSHSHKERMFAFGFPTLDGSRIKVGFPVTGVIVERPDLNPEPRPGEREVFDSGRLGSVLAGVLPGHTELTACQYDNSPDFDFILGPMPGQPRITVLGGFSGHGFKHAPAVGECAAALATGAVPPLDLGSFSPGRRALALRR